MCKDFLSWLPALLLAAALPVIPAHAAKSVDDPRTWIVDMSPGHVAFVRIVSGVDPLNKAVEFKVAYKDPLSPDGGDVMAFDLDFACPETPDNAVGEITFKRGEMWARNSPAQLSAVSAVQFDAMRGRATLEKARVCVCATSRYRLEKFVYVRVSPLTHTYFALVDQGIHYELAMALSNVSASNRLSKTHLGSFGVPLDKRDAVIAILGKRVLTTDLIQAVP